MKAQTTRTLPEHQEVLNIMRKSYFRSFAVTCLLLTTVPAWAQRGMGGAHASMGSRISGRGEIRTISRPTIVSSRSANIKTHAAARSNAEMKTTGLERAETAQSANTKAAANRGFAVAPGVENAEGKQAAKATAASQSNLSATARGSQSGASETANVGASLRTGSTFKAGNGFPESMNSSATANSQANSNNNLAVRPGRVSASSHTSFGGRVMQKLHLKSKQ